MASQGSPSSIDHSSTKSPFVLKNVIKEHVPQPLGDKVLGKVTSTTYYSQSPAPKKLVDLDKGVGTSREPKMPRGYPDIEKIPMVDDRRKLPVTHPPFYKAPEFQKTEESGTEIGPQAGPNTTTST